MKEIKYTNLEAIMRKYAESIEKDFIASVIAHKKNGRVDKTFSVKVEFLDYKYIISIQIEDYWKYVENGRKPGTFPNLPAIIKWINYKNILPRKDSGIRTKDQLAYLIGRSIKENGIKPLPLLQKALKNNNDEFEGMILSALQKDIDEYLSEIMDNNTNTLK